MRRPTRAIVSLVAVSLIALPIAPSVWAATDLSGTWNSASLRQGGPGYAMKLESASSGGQDPNNAYEVVLRFHFQDGRLGPRIKAGMTHEGRKVWLLLDGKGALADTSNPNIMRGTIGQDGSLYLPTCYKQLKFVTRKNAPTMCLFQEMPVPS